MTAPTLPMARCRACHAITGRRPGFCPRCGAIEREPIELDAHGTIVAATEIASPPADAPGPVRIALVALADGVTLVAAVDGPVPASRSEAVVHWDGRRYVAASAPGPAGNG